MIFESRTIEYKFYHTREEISAEGHFDIDFRQLKELEANFCSSVERLSSYYYSERSFFAIGVHRT